MVTLGIVTSSTTLLALVMYLQHLGLRVQVIFFSLQEKKDFIILSLSLLYILCVVN